MASEANGTALHLKSVPHWGHRRIKGLFLSSENPAGPHQRDPDRVRVARLTGFLGPDEGLSNTRDSLLHPALVDVPSVQPVSALATRLRGWRAGAPEFGRLCGQSPQLRQKPRPLQLHATTYRSWQVLHKSWEKPRARIPQPRKSCSSDGRALPSFGRYALMAIGVLAPVYAAVAVLVGLY
jgi:hypothetical protein